MCAISLVTTETTLLSDVRLIEFYKFYRLLRWKGCANNNTYSYYVSYLSCKMVANSLQKSPPCLTYLRKSSKPFCPCNKNKLFNQSLFLTTIQNALWQLQMHQTVVTYRRYLRSECLQ